MSFLIQRYFIKGVKHMKDNSRTSYTVMRRTTGSEREQPYGMTTLPRNFGFVVTLLSVFVYIYVTITISQISRLFFLFWNWCIKDVKSILCRGWARNTGLLLPVMVN